MVHSAKIQRELTMMTGQRSLAEIEAKLDLSDVRNWAVHVSRVASVGYATTYVSWDRIP
jgi:hypothetical protein